MSVFLCITSFALWNSGPGRGRQKLYNHSRLVQDGETIEIKNTLKQVTILSSDIEKIGKIEV